MQAEYESLQGPSGTLNGFRRDPMVNNKEESLIAEARALRQHKGRLESRMELLEEQNQELESQLDRLRKLLEPDSPVKESQPQGETLDNRPIANDNIRLGPVTEQMIARSQNLRMNAK